MAIDPNIALQIRPVEAPTFADSYGRALNIQRQRQQIGIQQQQMEENALGIAKQQRMEEDDARVMDAFRLGKDPDEVLGILKNSGVHNDTFSAIAKQLDARKKADLDAKKGELEVGALEDKRNLGMVYSMMDLSPEQLAANWGPFKSKWDTLNPKNQLSSTPLDRKALEKIAALLTWESSYKERKIEERAATAAADVAAREAAQLPGIEADAAGKVAELPARVKRAEMTAADPLGQTPGEAAQAASRKIDDERAERQFTETKRSNLEQERRGRASEAQGKSTAMLIPDGKGGYSYQKISEGQVVPPGAITPTGLSATNVPTAATRQMAEKAPRVLDLTARVEQLLAENEKQLGPLASRWDEFTVGKVGVKGKGYTQLRTDIGLLSTALMNMHVGSRGGEAMMEHFANLLKLSVQDPENLRAALGEIKLYAKQVEREAKPRGNEGEQPAAPSSYSQTATGPNGHKIGSNDGATWFDVGTGKKVE